MEKIDLNQFLTHKRFIPVREIQCNSLVNTLILHQLKMDFKH